MDGPKSTTIEYVFEGNTLNLQQAVDKVRAMLNATARELRKMQGGKLTSEQEKQLKNLRALASQMAKNAKGEKTLTEEQKKRTIVAGRYALSEAKKFSQKAAQQKKQQQQQADKQQQKDAEAAQKKQEKVEQLTSTAGQEAAAQRARYLDEYADKFKHVMSEEAYDEVKGAIADFRAATEDETLSEEELAEQTEKLNNVYRDYSATMQAINRSQQQASKGILSFSDFVNEAQRRISVGIKSFDFWLQMIRKVVQAVSQYNQMLEQLRRSGQLNNPNLKGIKETADAWRSLSRQVSLFMTNVGGLVSTVLAPIVKVLSGALMLINAIIASISGVDALAENARAGAGLTNLDEINTQQESEEDNLKKMVRGWQDVQEAIGPALELAQTFGQLIRDIGSIFSNAFLKSLERSWDFIKPIIDGILYGLNMILLAIEWVVGWVAKAVDWFTQLLGVTGDWTKEGTAVYEVLKWIGIAVSGLVAIALSKYVLAAASSFGKLAVSVATATAKLVAYVAEQLVAIATSIKSTIVNWWENASLVAKIGLLTLGAGLIIVPIVLAATGAFTSKASEVPALANGGVVNYPTMTLIGEGKYSEAVVPLGNSPQFAAMKKDIATSVVQSMSSSSTSSGSGTTPVILSIDGRTLARALLPYVGYTQPQTGVKLK